MHVVECYDRSLEKFWRRLRDDVTGAHFSARYLVTEKWRGGAAVDTGLSLGSLRYYYDIVVRYGIRNILYWYINLLYKSIDDSLYVRKYAH